MATEPGNTEGNKPTGDSKATGEPTPADGPTTPAPGPTSAPTPSPSGGPGLIASPLSATPGPPEKPPASPLEKERLVEKPTPPRPSTPSLSARSVDRLAAMAPPPKRRRGGCLTFLLAIAIVAGGGYLLWRDGRLDPLIAWAQPYTDKLAPIVDEIRPIVAKIEALIPGHRTPAAEPDDAMILETKQLLLKLDFQPGPMNGTLDPATVAAIEAYQETAGLPIDGQPSQALLDDLRAVTSPASN